MGEVSKVYSYARYSSTIQGEGYSIARQEKRAREWCEKMGLALEQFHFDEGRSAYHGKHKAQGTALHGLLEEIRAGRIEKGSYLVIEAFDRLSRLPLIEAQSMILEILRSGITIVTLSGGEERHLPEQDLGAAINILIALEAARKESETKADRSIESWNRRIENARNGKIIGRNHPKWLKIVNDKFELIPDRVETMKRMFQWAAEGMGTTAMARRLTEGKIPSWGKKAATWYPAVVHRFLTAPSAIGTLEIRRNGGNKSEDGRIEVVENYYPAIISSTLFEEVNYLIKKRTPKNGSPKAGRKGKYNNILPNGKCGYCGGSFVWRNNKSSSGRKHYRLACGVAKFGSGCKYVSMDYESIREAVLKYCIEIDIEELLKADKPKALDEANQRLKEIRSELNATDGHIENTLATMEKVSVESMRNRAAARLDELGLELENLKQAEKGAMEEVTRLSRAGNTLKGHLVKIRALSKKLNHKDETVQVETRRKLRYTIEQAVDEIVFYPEGLQNRITRFTEHGIELVEDGFNELIREYPEYGKKIWKNYISENTGKKSSAFIVRFRNGHSRLFKLRAESKAYEQIAADANGKFNIGGFSAEKKSTFSVQPVDR